MLGVPTDLDELAGSGILERRRPGPRRRRRRRWPRPTDDVTIGALDAGAARRRGRRAPGRPAGRRHQRRRHRPAEPGRHRPPARRRRPQRRRHARRGVPGAAGRRSPTRRAPVFFAPRGGMGALVDALVADLERRGVDVVPGPAVGDRARAARRGTSPSTSGRRAATCRAPPARCSPPTVWWSPPRRRRPPRSCATPRPRRPRCSPRSPTRPWRWSASRCRATAIDRELDGSGFLVPRVEGRTITACSWTSSKWPHLAGDGTVWLRASVGRDGDDAALALDDAGCLDRRGASPTSRDTMALRGPARPRCDGERASESGLRSWHSFPPPPYRPPATLELDVPQPPDRQADRVGRRPAPCVSDRGRRPRSPRPRCPQPACRRRAPPPRPPGSYATARRPSGRHRDPPPSRWPDAASASSAGATVIGSRESAACDRRPYEDHDATATTCRHRISSRRLDRQLRRRAPSV